ncbi:MAG TPA: adenylate/guanylate cyclase domain-containing protein [Candidatus Didemnitutus sp.]|nr:adenylate/guanylate cyclase domain-containing protein [Candidatus Didemnitutus sp.]
MSKRTIEELREDISVAIHVSDTDGLRACAQELLALGTPDARAAAERALGILHNILGDYEEALRCFNRSLALFEELGDHKYAGKVTMGIGLVHHHAGNRERALEYYHRSLAVHETLGDRSGAVNVLGNIGALHSDWSNYPEALECYNRALAVLHELHDTPRIALVLGNLGNVYRATGNYPEALQYLHRALAHYQERGDRIGSAGVICSLGKVYRATGNYSEALDHYHQALAIHEELGVKLGVADDNFSIGNVLFQTGDLSTALEHYRRALALQEECNERSSVVMTTCAILGCLIQMELFSEAEELFATTTSMTISEPSLAIYILQLDATLHEHHGRYDEAAALLQTALSSAREHTLLSVQADLHKQYRDLCQKKNDFSGYIEHNNEYTRINEEINGKDTATKLAMQESERKMAKERQEHEQHLAVLYSTLPKHIADRVARGEVVNDTFENAAVLFLDIVGFTRHSGQLDASVVVQLLQNIFTTFDIICAEHDVMKIKTIGDSYMAVAFDIADAVGARPRLAREQTGIAREQTEIANSEQRIANVALEMMASEFTWPNTGERVIFRIGIHCGPVVAGVLGTERMQYDVWGDTVNVASRMESTSEPGRIQISEALANALHEHKNSPPDPLSHASLERGSYTVIPRGTVDVKGKGMMQTYWLE